MFTLYQFLILSSNTTKNASFAGSMQLLAGVKCCTGRKLTNHPHFEDKILRQATREVKIKYLLNAFLITLAKQIIL